MEGAGFSEFVHSDMLELPYGIEKIALLAEVDVVVRDAGKAGEGEDGAGGQGDGTAALASATGVSAGPR